MRGGKAWSKVMFSMIDDYDFNNYDDDNGIGDGHDF